MTLVRAQRVVPIFPGSRPARRPAARWLLVVAFGLVACAWVARAHDPFEVGVLARLHQESFVVRITLARSTAFKLCASATGGRRTFEKDQFETIRPAFENCARDLVVLERGGEKLAPRTVNATLTIDEDIELEIVFPRPAAGPLHVDAGFMRVLGEGYGGTLVVADGNVVLCDKRIQIEMGTDADVMVPTSAKSMDRP